MRNHAGRSPEAAIGLAAADASAEPLENVKLGVPPREGRQPLLSRVPPDRGLRADRGALPDGERRDHQDTVFVGAVCRFDGAQGAW
ncbi:MAG TPA: hypothetical protein VF139_16300 [Candidatus Polarisedimenticolaceae bacterium]